MSDQVIAAIQALLEDGQRLENTAIYGDSSGGGLAAAVILKMRDPAMGMPKAAALVSPWLDVTPAGDTETTLHDADPNQLYEKHGIKSGCGVRGFQGSEKSLCITGIWRFYQGFPSHAHSRRFKGNTSQRFRPPLSGTRCGRSTCKVRPVRRDDPQLSGSDSCRARVDIGSSQDGSISASTSGDMKQTAWSLLYPVKRGLNYWDLLREAQ
jgi:acetyl esterase/lipase